MIIRRFPIITFEEKKRFADFFIILMTIDRKNAKRIKRNKKQKTKLKCDDSGFWTSLGIHIWQLLNFVQGPCFSY